LAIFVNDWGIKYCCCDNWILEVAFFPIFSFETHFQLIATFFKFFQSIILLWNKIDVLNFWSKNILIFFSNLKGYAIHMEINSKTHLLKGRLRKIFEIINSLKIEKSSFHLKIQKNLWLSSGQRVMELLRDGRHLECFWTLYQYATYATTISLSQNSNKFLIFKREKNLIILRQKIFFKNCSEPPF
jgi:hypothetical protein